MKRVIVPFDFSDEARNGISLAIVLAEQFNATIQLVYVQRKHPDFAHVGLKDEKLYAINEFEKLAKELEPNLPKGVQLEYIVKQGKVYREVVAQGEAFEEAVIVTSTHGASGFEEFFIGSNTLKMIAATSIPIYTIKHGVIPQPVKSIIFPIDTTFMSRQKAPYVAMLAKRWQATVHIIGNAESDNTEVANRIKMYIEQVQDFFSELKVAHQTASFKGDDLVQTTLEYAGTKPDSLIAITSTDKETLPLLMIGDKAQRLLAKAPVPVLVLAPNVETIKGSFKTFG